MGKSGIIGKKISSTLSSTGTPSFFVHPAEGLHGDLGIIVNDDVVILISNSGETEEILKIMPLLKKRGISIISLTGNPKSTLALHSDFTIDVGVEKEACPLNAAPTASTTSTLAMGDAFAVCLLSLKGFSEKDFAKLHPGGSLGKKFFLTVDDIMHSGDSNALIEGSAGVKEAIIEISKKGLGAVNVIDGAGVLKGIITDGDLRRAFEKDDNPLSLKAKDIMTKSPVTIRNGELALKAVHLMEDRPNQIMVLPVVDEKLKPVGLVRLHDVVKKGLV
jgi:arabinose-5-phosphate isomerase